MSLLRPLIGGVLCLGALGLLGGCAAASDAPAASNTTATAAAAVTTANTTASGDSASSPVQSASPAPTSSGQPSSSAPTTAESVLPIQTSGPAPSRLTTPSSVVGGTRMTLVGTVEEGVEASCLILTDEKTGQRFNLTGGDKTVVRPGARVTVVGVVRTDMMSYCQQGHIFQVLKATKA